MKRAFFLFVLNELVKDSDGICISFFFFTEDGSTETSGCGGMCL